MYAIRSYYVEAFEAGLKFHGSQFVVLSGNRKKIMSAIEDKGSIGVSENIQDNSYNFV